jgi:enoyl-CoA hydratase/carnithine racemase
VTGPAPDVAPDVIADPASDLVVVTDDDGVRLVTFNRPEARNAFNWALYEAATGALIAAAADDAVRVVVLTGAGTAFSAGQDLKEMAALVTGEADPEAAKGFRGFMDALCGFDKPLLAAVNGVGVGLGFTMLAHCDIVLVSDEARLRVPFAELGVPAEAASSYLFPLRMGAQRAAEVLFTGAWVTAPEAVEAGIALRRVAPEALLAETMALAQRIASGSPEALRAIKALMLAPQATAVAEARRREDEAFARLLGSATNTAALDRFGTTGTL